VRELSGRRGRSVLPTPVGVALLLASMGTWTILVLGFVRFVAPARQHLIYACVSLDDAKVQWPSLAVLLLLLLTVNVVAAFIRGSDGRFAQCLSLIVSLPVLWALCGMVSDALSACMV